MGPKQRILNISANQPCELLPKGPHGCFFRLLTKGGRKIPAVRSAAGWGEKRGSSTNHTRAHVPVPSRSLAWLERQHRLLCLGELGLRGAPAHLGCRDTGPVWPRSSQIRRFWHLLVLSLQSPQGMTCEDI